MIYFLLNYRRMHDVYTFDEYTQLKEHLYREYYKIFCNISIGTCIV